MYACACVWCGHWQSLKFNNARDAYDYTRYRNTKGGRIIKMEKYLMKLFH